MLEVLPHISSLDSAKVSESFSMRYCATLYLKGYQKYNRSKLKVKLLSNKFRLFYFNILYF